MFVLKYIVYTPIPKEFTYLECWSLSSINGRTAGIISRGKIWLTIVRAMHTSTRLVLCKSWRDYKVQERFSVNSEVRGSELNTAMVPHTSRFSANFILQEYPCFIRLDRVNRETQQKSTNPKGNCILPWHWAKQSPF